MAKGSKAGHTPGISSGKFTGKSKSTGKTGVGHPNVSSGKLSGGSKQSGTTGKGHEPLK